MTALRSKCVKGIRSDFKNMHKCIHCPLKCNDDIQAEDTHEHILKCTRLSGSNVSLDFIHGSTVEQSLIATSMAELMRERTRILEEKDQLSQCCLPGAFLDQRLDLKSSKDYNYQYLFPPNISKYLQPCIV